MRCSTCGYEGLPEEARFCFNCGAQLLEASEDAPAKEIVSPKAGEDSRQITDAPALQTYGTRLRLEEESFYLPPTLKQPTFGREEQLDQIEAALRKRQTVLVHGVPGLGKTDLAAEATRRLNAAGTFPDGIVWVNKVGTASAAVVCDAIAIHLGNNEIPKLAAQAKLELTRKLLDTLEVLLVLDDLATGETADTFVNLCHLTDTALLATSRHQYAGFKVDVTISPLDRDTAISLFRERALADELVGEICDLLENHPLGLVYAAGLIRGIALPKLKAQLADEKDRLQPVKGEQRGGEILNVRAALERSYAGLTKRQQRIFTYMAACFSDAIGVELLADACGGGTTEFKGHIDRLARQALVEREGDRLCIHWAARSFGRETLGVELQPAQGRILKAVLKYAARYNQATPEHYDKLEAELGNLSEAVRYAVDREQWQSAIKLADQLYGVLESRSYWTGLLVVGQLGILAAKRSGDERARARLLYKTAVTLKNRGNHIEASRVSRQSLEISEKLGDSAGIADALRLLGLLAQSQSNYDEARSYYQRERDLRQELNDQAGRAASLHQLGVIAQSQLNYPEAEQHYQEALEVRRGEDHPDVGQSLNSLALLYESMGRYADAEHLYKEALKIHESAPGENRLELAGSLNNLAGLCYAMGEYTEAERYYRRALDIRRETLDNNHPDVAQSLNNLAGLYYAMGNYSAAAPYSQQALEIYRATVGEEHPHFATALNNLAGLYYAMGNYTTAEELYQQALAIRRSALGKDHPDVAQSLNNLALLYEATGRYFDARPLLEEAREIYRVCVGDAHPHFAQSLNNLALVYQALGNYTGAEPLLKQALAIRRNALREGHPDIAQSLTNLALLYESLQNYSEAAPLLEEAVKIYSASLGENHPHVAQTLNNLALIYEAMDKHAEAGPLYRQAAEIYRSTVGESHPDFAATLNNLAELYRTIGKYKEAESRYMQILEIYRNTRGKDECVARTLYSLGKITREQKDYPKSRQFFEEGLEINRNLADQIGIANVLDQLGQLSYDQQDYEEAGRFYQESLEISRKMNDQVGIARSTHQLGLIAQARSNYEEARGFYNQSLEASERLGNRINIARNLERLGQLAKERGDHDEAQLFDQKSQAISESLNLIEPLRNILIERLDEREIREVVSALGIDGDSLPGESHSAKAIELIAWSYRNDKVKELQEMLRQRRPDIAI